MRRQGRMRPRLVEGVRGSFVQVGLSSSQVGLPYASHQVKSASHQPRWGGAWGRGGGETPKMPYGHARPRQTERKVEDEGSRHEEGISLQKPGPRRIWFGRWRNVCFTSLLLPYQSGLRWDCNAGRPFLCSSLQIKTAPCSQRLTMPSNRAGASARSRFR